MADNTTLDPGSGGDTIATDDISGIKHQLVKVEFGAADSATQVSSGNPLPVVQTGTPGLPTGASTAAKQPALGTAGTPSTDVLSVQGVAGGTAVPVSGTVTATGPLTDTQLRATAVPVSGTVTASGPLTDTQLRATAVPVSGTVTANLGTAAVTNAGTFAVQDSQKVTDDAAFTVGTTKVQPVGYLADQTSTDSVDEGDIGAARMTLDRKQIVTLAPSVDTEGATTAVNVDIDESEDAVKTSAGKLLAAYVYNDGTAEVYLKFYNDTVANVVVGTTVPAMTLPIPAGSAFTENWGSIGGIPFSAAITIAATTGATTADTGAPATNQVVGTILYV